MPRYNALAALLLAMPAAAQQPGAAWPTYGGDPGGTRFSAAARITRSNLDRLHPLWTFHTHALDRYSGATRTMEDPPSFESTPVLSGDTLYFTSPYDVVFALDARNGAERWRFDPQLPALKPGGIVTNRGVALWPLGTAASITPCERRVFVATLDARLLALDATTGKPCAGFGANGTVDLKQGVHFQGLGYYGNTSPPTIVGDTVVVGSYIGDNLQVDVESGAVRGFDARSGKGLWSWEPLPWAAAQKVRTGAGNAWTILAADPALGLVYVPTGSPSPDYFGGLRPGDDRDADSIVALDAATGRKVWAFQTTHHDVWDYDIASEPVLFTWHEHTPQATPAIAVTTKMGLIFLLDRRTGAPLLPVEERPVPQAGVKDEPLSPTQPFQNIPALSPLALGNLASTAFDRSPADLDLCRRKFAALRYDGIYTPPTLQGSLLFPGNVGGVNWGGAAFDPNTGILYANSNREAFSARLVPRLGREHLTALLLDALYNQDNTWLLSKTLWLLAIVMIYAVTALRRRSPRPGLTVTLALLVFIAYVFGHHLYLHREARSSKAMKLPVLAHFGFELSEQRKSPYLIERHPIVDSHGYSCTPAPWGGIAAVNLNTLAKVWERPLGTMVPGRQTGVLNFGGPIVTASGLVFTAATDDPWLRVFDAATGDLLRELPLPAPGVATPMTYTLNGRQYLIIAAGGHGDGYSKLGDSLVAFALD